MAIGRQARSPSRDYSTSAGFHPIALTSFVCKLLEKIVNVRLVHFLKQGGHLSLAQCNFRRFPSTLDTFFRLEGALCEAFLRK